ncbi:MAG: hypothetical protein ACOY82_14465 [Pseudomonadota bacterium]
MADTVPSKKAWYEILIALTPLIVGVGVTGVGAYFTQVNNYRQLQANQLSALDKLRPLLISDDPFDREFAYASFVALGHEQLALRLMQLKQDSAGRAVAQRMQKGASGDMQDQAGAALQAIPAEIYIHIAHEAQRAKATELGDALRRKGYSVAPLELVADKTASPSRDNLLYFNDQDKDVAAKVADVLGEHGMRGVAVDEIAHNQARPGSLEIWFAATPAATVPASKP